MLDASCKHQISSMQDPAIIERLTPLFAGSGEGCRAAEEGPGWGRGEEANAYRGTGDKETAAGEGPAAQPLTTAALPHMLRHALLPQVLAHPGYKADPIAAVTRHLSSTLPAAPELPKPMADPLVLKQQKARRKWEQRLQRQTGSAMTID